MRHSFLLFICVLLLGCEQSPKPLNVDAIYSNGVIWTGAPNKPDAQIIAVDDGKIVFVGQQLPSHISSDVTLTYQVNSSCPVLWTTMFISWKDETCALRLFYGA